MTQPINLLTPVGDYELLDFGAGRKLERFGAYCLDRPDPLAQGERRLAAWEADWRYVTVAATQRWQAARADLPERWSLELDGLKLAVCLQPDGGVGLDPGQVLCRRWVHQRLAGAYHIEDLTALNLFAGAGGVSHAAVQGGAQVTHVDSRAAALELAQDNLAGLDVAWVHEDANAFVDAALREGRRYHLIVVRPPQRQRGPHQRSWDIKIDLAALMAKLPRLVREPCLGVWLAPHGMDFSADSLVQLLRDALPGNSIDPLALGVATADGRVLPQGVAARLYDDEEVVGADGERPPLSAAKIEERLDPDLDPVLSSRRTAAAPARELADFSRAQQEFVLRWVQIIARTNAEMAYQFTAQAPRALRLLAEDDVEAWLLRAMDAFDVAGLHAGMAAFEGIESFAEEVQASATRVLLDEVYGVLEKFVHGLNGRKLKLEPGTPAYTDTETLFLPESVNRCATREDNFRLLKATAAHLWAQAWFGTFDDEVFSALADYDDVERAVAWFHALETVRLDACIARELPGLAREMTALVQAVGDAPWPAAAAPSLQPLRQPAARVQDVLAALAEFYAGAGEPPQRCYQGALDLARAAAVRSARIEREAAELSTVLARLADEVRRRRTREGLETGAAPPEFELGEERADGTFELILDGAPIEPPGDVRSLTASILQDLGQIPPEYLVAAGDGAYQWDTSAEDDRSHDVWKGTYHEEGAWLYNEWDHKRQHYRKNWCVLRELDVAPKSLNFVERALRKHGGLVKEIRRTFEALRGEDRMLKKQPYGDDVDIDALVEAYGDSRDGRELTDRLFIKRHKVERDIAVMFMVDMSGSTKGWINDAEREALLLLCEALEILGDRYAIYGFSGNTRKRCELYRVKQFDESYGDLVKGRISGIQPQDYTRMGVVIRHLVRLLNEVEARTKLLITLSDGKPDDFDGYRGEYGIEDTRRALIEAKRDGVHPFCITIDREASDYLPHMYGAVNYAVLDEVRKLPLKVSDIYRRLTTR